MKETKTEVVAEALEGSTKRLAILGIGNWKFETRENGKSTLAILMLFGCLHKVLCALRERKTKLE